MTRTPLRTLPAPVGALLALLPAYPGSVLLATALNLALAHQLPQDVLQMLLHKRVRIHVSDARLTFDFSWNGSRFIAVPGAATATATAPPDLSLRASANDFLLLAQRREDPDTLFFNRRLVTEGDTELGLVVKNALDALELPVLDPRQWTPRRVLQALAPHAQRTGVGRRHPGAD